MHNKAVYREMSSHLEPPLRHEEVVFDTLFSKLVGHVEPHGAIFIVDLAFGLIGEDWVGIVDFFELFCCFRVVWILVWMVFQSQFSVKQRILWVLNLTTLLKWWIKFWISWLCKIHKKWREKNNNEIHIFLFCRTMVYKRKIWLIISLYTYNESSQNFCEVL